MRIASWNVNGLRARLDFVRHWLDARKPDLVGIQELKLTDEQLPEDELREAGYQVVAHGQKGWNGVAVLAREPLEAVQRGLPGQEAFGARLIEARQGELRFVTIYVPNGKTVSHEDFPKKLAWYDTLAAWLESEHDPQHPLVLCGDFNLVPEPIDSWNEEKLHGRIFHTDEERKRWRRLVEWGLHDVYREQNPQTQAFSWWDYRGGAFHRGHGLRIDFLLATAPIASRVREAWIDRDYRKKKDGLTASDHAPVLAELDD